MELEPANPARRFAPVARDGKIKTKEIMSTKTSSKQNHTCCGGTVMAVPTGGGTAKEWLVNGNLDVRALPPARRHSLIFESYRNLGQGESFVLVNDHDPKPLYYQFSAEHEGQFTWAYEEQGPEVWRVRIGKPEGATAAKN